MSTLGQGNQVMIVDESCLPGEYGRLHQHYKNGTIASIVDVFNGFVSIQAISVKGSKINPSSILLGPDNLHSIRVIN